MKKILLFMLVVASIVAVSCELDCSHETLLKYSAVESTCTTQGTIEYWECYDCHRKFADSYATVEVTDISSPLNPNNHDFTYHTVKAATCTDTGVKAYYECNDCHGKYADESGATVLTDLTIPVDPTAHYSTVGKCITFTSYTAQTCTTAGCVEHSHCANCGKDFKTVGLANVNIDDVEIPRHTVDPATRCCVNCGEYIVSAWDELTEALALGKTNIGFAKDIVWKGLSQPLDLPSTSLDLNTCSFGYDGDVNLTGDFTIKNGTVIGNVIAKKAPNKGFKFKNVSIVSKKDALITDSDGILIDVKITTSGYTGISVDGYGTLAMHGDNEITADCVGINIDSNAEVNIWSSTLTINVNSKTPLMIKAGGSFLQDPGAVCIF